jgi:hypothetical protein
MALRRERIPLLSPGPPSPKLPSWDSITLVAVCKRPPAFFLFLPPALNAYKLMKIRHKAMMMGGTVSDETGIIQYRNRLKAKETGSRGNQTQTRKDYKLIELRKMGGK